MEQTNRNSQSRQLGILETPPLTELATREEALRSEFLADRHDIDAKLGRIAMISQVFGMRAVEVIMLGLSRRFKPTPSEASILIDEWERRDIKCCYRGSIEELLALKDTFVLSISYAHAPYDRWFRKGPERMCKFPEEDEALFKAAVRGIGEKFHYPYLIVWCDQVLTTRFQSRRIENKFSTDWILLGLFPFMTFQVLQLSTHIPEEIVEQRVWIRFERSLGRASQGCITANDAAIGIVGGLGTGEGCRSCVMNISKNILSGYLPEDLGYWSKDFKDLKQWALGILCRGCKNIVQVELFKDHDPVDNIEILLNVNELARLPVGLQNEEPVLYISDKSFFLKATAWNLSVQTIWNAQTQYLSHYMGEMKSTMFSWWRCDSSNILFGCLADYAGASATTILAIENNDAYKVFRSMGDLTFYRHAEKFVSGGTRRLIQESGEKAGVHFDNESVWRLIYCSNDNDITTKTPKVLLNALGQGEIESAVQVPPVFRGMTTKLYKSAVAASEGREGDIARKIGECVEKWSEYVKSHYPEWIAVKDSFCGPVWLEGYDSKRLSFGFLEFLTEALILRRHRISTNACRIPKPEDLQKELQSVAVHGKVEERILATELFETNDNGNWWNSLTLRDVVRFLFCGGFSKCFFPGGLWAFLASSARLKGYWTTTVVCRSGKMQIRFMNLDEIRIVQRATELGDCMGVGFVRPIDHQAVMSISEECDMGLCPGMTVFWKDMHDTTTREEMLRIFNNSKCNWDRKEILLVDMTVGTVIEEDSVLQEEDVERWKGVLRF